MRSIYCPRCDEWVEVDVHEAMVELPVKKVSVHALQLQAFCPRCGDPIADEDISRRNLDAAFAAYRAEEGLLSPEQIKDAYARYGLTQKSFAALLNLGGATLSRYEHGAVQTKQIDAAIRRASQPENMLALLDEHAGEIPSDQEDFARQAALSLMGGEAGGCVLADGKLGNFHLALSNEAPNQRNGFRRLDWDRIVQMIVYMASQCAALGKTKLNKALFYSDYACFVGSSCSMSGLVYARAPHGPIVDQYGVLFGEMVRQGYLVEEQVFFGPVEATVFKPNVAFDSSVFTEYELAILEKVAAFVNGFDTAEQLSEYSHKEKLWIENGDGCTLSYLDAFELNGLERFVGTLSS